MYVQTKQGGLKMFDKNPKKPGPVKAKWGLEPKGPASGGKKYPTSPGQGYTNAGKPAKGGTSYSLKPAKGGM
jgi:hypothetical protein